MNNEFTKEEIDFIIDGIYLNKREWHFNKKRFRISFRIFKKFDIKYPFLSEISDKWKKEFENE